MTDKELRISVYCPNCKKRVLDKISPTSGKIETKCPHCKQIVAIDLSFRLANKTRYSNYIWIPKRTEQRIHIVEIANSRSFKSWIIVLAIVLFLSGRLLLLHYLKGDDTMKSIKKRIGKPRIRNEPVLP